MPQDLRIITRQHAGCTILELHGDLTMLSEGELTRGYRAAAESGTAGCILSFEHVDYINSAGIASIITLLTEARAADHMLVLCALSPHYQKIFRMVGLTQYAAIFDSEALAEQALAARPGPSDA